MNEALDYSIVLRKIELAEQMKDQLLGKNEEYMALKQELASLESKIYNLKCKIQNDAQNEIEVLNDEKEHEHNFVTYKTTNDHDGYSRVSIEYTSYQQCCICGEKRTKTSTSRY